MLFRFNVTGSEIIQIGATITLNSDMWSLFTNRHRVLSETVCILIIKPTRSTNFSNLY